MVDVLVRRHDDAVPLPGYAHPGDAGADLVTTVDVTLAPGERVKVPTGVSFALPDGYVALIHPRSGLAAEHGVSIVNAPGTVDAGFRGEIQVLLVNLDASRPVRLHRGDRIAQVVFQQVERARFVEVERLPGSARGVGGYGSTGGVAGAAAMDPITDPTGHASTADVGTAREDEPVAPRTTTRRKQEETL